MAQDATATTQLIAEGIGLLGQLFVNTRKPQHNDRQEERQDIITKIDEMQQYIDGELTKMRTTNQAVIENEDKETVVQNIISLETKKKAQGLSAHEGDGIGMACLPCTRAHLITVRGTLKEALRFALGESEGVAHPEVQQRIDTAVEELVVMERFDLAPEKIAKTSNEERAVINEMLPQIRTLRQDLLNGPSTPEELQDLTSAVDELYKQVRTRTGGSTINWAKVDRDIDNSEGGI